MAIPNQPFIAHVTMVFSRDSRIFENTFHLFKAAGWTLTTLMQAAVDTVSWWNLYYKFCCGNGVALTTVQIRLYDPANPLAFDQPVSPPVAGNQAATMEAANATLTFSWRTGRAGRKERGRIYLVGLTEPSVNTNDTVTSAQLAQMATAAAQFVSIIWSNGVVPAIFHRATATYTPINSYVLENVVDSQRRRLPGRGR
jgi:hypothetical protein